MRNCSVPVRITDLSSLTPPLLALLSMYPDRGADTLSTVSSSDIRSAIGREEMAYTGQGSSSREERLQQKNLVYDLEL
jgi:hypothetical protein